jgi:DNA-binding NarL/FixJ family response regulator
MPYITRKMPLEDLEAKLFAQFGDKLQPRRFRVEPPQQPTEKEFPRQNPPPAAWKHERAKMQIEHLTAERYLQLVEQGKNITDVARMYNTAEAAIRAKIRNWERKAND